MTRLQWTSTCFLALLAASTTTLYAADCASLRTLKLRDTMVTAADSIEDGALQVPGQPPMSGLPPFCRVTGIFQPTADSQIRFEIWLPEKDWNQRFLGVGNGGFAGSIGYRELAGNVRRGYATAGSDTGHQADAEDASWAYGHPEKIKDFGWRAVHLTAERAKEVIAAYYGKPVSKSYFDSCSDGGREALMEAQRFPEDYDGILAGAPANNWSHMVTAGIDVAQVTVGHAESYISSLKLPAIQKASLAACDALDGVTDGIINDPSKCHFDPQVLLCKATDSLDCLTQPQVNSLKKYYAGGSDGHGTLLFPGFTMGDESTWGSWIVGEAPGAASGAQYLQGYFRYMVTGDQTFNPLTADVAQAMQQATEKTAADLDSTNPDLSKLAARGGKLIMYHGWNDPAISPYNTIAYYHSVQKAMGEQKADAFMRLYMVPGMEHCAGGPGTSAFGQLGIPTSSEPRYGVFDALVGWVEKGTLADTVIATKFTPNAKGENQVTMTRPLCPYPSSAQYKGPGDTNQAASFTCAR